MERLAEHLQRYLAALRVTERAKRRASAGSFIKALPVADHCATALALGRTRTSNLDIGAAAAETATAISALAEARL